MFIYKGRDRRGLFSRKFPEDHYVCFTKDKLITYHEIAVGRDDSVSFGSTEVHCNVNISVVKTSTLSW